MKLVAFVLFAAAFLIFVQSVLDSGSLPRRQKTKAELSRLDERNSALRAEVQALETQVAAHRDRPDVRARAVRDELNYVKPGDVVIDFRDR
ncbi:MAG: septum formation initiator family protein [Myxococcota bacterium]